MGETMTKEQWDSIGFYMDNDGCDDRAMLSPRADGSLSFDHGDCQSISAADITDSDRRRIC